MTDNEKIFKHDIKILTQVSRPRKLGFWELLFDIAIISSLFLLFGSILFMAFWW